jgi:hypothetical protein
VGFDQLLDLIRDRPRSEPAAHRHDDKKEFIDQVIAV